MTEAIHTETQVHVADELIVPRMHDDDWAAKIVCGPATGDEMFPKTRTTGTTPEEKDLISRYCALCPVREECLINALRNDFRQGIQGGIAESQRRTIHDTFQKVGAFTVSAWNSYVSSAITTRDTFSTREKLQFAKLKKDRELVLTTLREKTDGTLVCEDVNDLAQKLGELSGLHYLRVKHSIEYLANTGKIFRHFEKTGNRQGKRLTGIELELGAA